MASQPDERKNRGANRGELSQAADDVLEEAVSRLRVLLTEMARTLKPFPAFLNMVSVQAVELDPSFSSPSLNSIEDRGCVVVAPGGTICSLELRLIPGVLDVADSGQVAELRELELPPVEYIVYASAAIRALDQEMRRRGL